MLSYEGLNGKTTIKGYTINIEEQNKWVTLIHNTIRLNEI
jgi:hypothetical protein